MDLIQVANLSPVSVTKCQPIQIGEYEVTAIPTGIFGLDGGAMFGTVPKVLWEKTNPCDDSNRIAMEARVMLLRSKNRLVLVDTGNGGDYVAKYGPKLGGKFAEMYGIASSDGLLKALGRLGIEADQVTDVVLTHLHFDHTGGSTRANSVGEVVSAFPRATYHVQSANLETARHPNGREKASYFAINFEPLVQAEQLKVWNTPVGFSEEILPGIRVAVSNGHTIGMQTVEVVSSPNNRGQAVTGEGELCGGILYCADLIPTSSHVRGPWIMGYDLDPLKIISEKTAALKMAAEKNLWLFFEHDAYCDLASIQTIDKDVAVKTRYKMPILAR